MGALALDQRRPLGPDRRLAVADPSGFGLIRMDGPPFTAVAWPRAKAIPARWHEPALAPAALAARGSAALLAKELTTAATDAQRASGGLVSPRPARAPRAARATRAPRPPRPSRRPRLPRRPRRPRLARAPREARGPAPPPPERITAWCGWSFSADGRLADAVSQGSGTERQMNAWKADQEGAEEERMQIGFLGALTRRRRERRDAVVLEIPRGTTCPEVGGNPCGEWVRLLAAPLQAALQWQRPAPPAAPALAKQRRAVAKRVPRVRRTWPVDAPPPISGKYCAFLLRQYRFLDARSACPPGQLFTIESDLAGRGPVPAAPERLGGVEVNGVIALLLGYPDAQPPRELVSLVAE